MDINFYYELNDVPNEAYPYGIAGWTKNDSPVIYDKYDLWLFDGNGEKEPTNITKQEGKTNDIRFRYVKLDKELQHLPEKLLLRAFNFTNKNAGFYSLDLGKEDSPKKLIIESYQYNTPVKAKKAEKLIWTKQSFQVYPNLYISNSDFSSRVKITDANPQQNNYIWGKVELVDWISFNGDSLKGLLYKPENFDPEKKYPMLVYFYERYSNSLHRYYTPKPIRSVINFSYYVSNGYLLFIPDIVYSVGYPGPSAFDCIVSGTQTMCDKYPYIDRDRLGIQGQSWGGYQVAYLVTKTNMYRAAMAGAPVSNMTSAYGGIRWGSGMSRAFQYEQTQSRIGGNLWDKLPLYMLNSPLFSADRIETPLLIMHNDKDGAVPWYQGIELFNAIRRLDKPVWMLVYNGAPHNLKRRANSKDLTI
jgi:dipeptidyl aminopeptidase/acylaminoacyl peptidase